NRRRSSLRLRALRDKLALQVATPDQDRDAVDEGLLAAITALPDAEREAFVLVAWDGLDPARAAVAAGCAPGTFRMRLHRARARLKRALGEDEATKTLEDSR
ncbi:MAG TPA: sigma factor-like helix-turn-helix DNA-binding protein, partial [Actinomycetota bacterium]|nr:sigma factor-like helix-turn-helix DNA-binding protein [Actinomycetota bacterium]